MTTFIDHIDFTLILQEGQAYAEENGLFFMETSAKTAQNVNEIFYEIGMPFPVSWYLILLWSQ